MHLKEHLLALRRARGRPRLLLHHLRLDDVELAGVRAGRGRDRWCSTTARPYRAAAACCSTSPPTRVTLFGIRPSTSTRSPRPDVRPGETPRPGRACGDPVDRVAARRRRASTTSTRDEARTCTSPRSAAAPTSSAASSAAIRRCPCTRRDPGPPLGWRSTCSTRRGRPLAGEKGELVCTAPFPTMPLGFWNDPRRRSTARPTSTTSPTCGVTATGARSRPPRRHHHLRPLRRGAESVRRAHRHGGDLPPGGEAGGSGPSRSSSDRTGARATSAWCCS